MLDEHLKSPVTRRRLCSGPVAAHIDDFADWLRRKGYRPISVASSLRSLAAWNGWLLAKGRSIQDADDALVACKAELDRGRLRYGRGPNKGSLAAARLFIRFLRERGVLPALPQLPRSPVLGEFRAWMQRHRGVRESSLDTYEGVIVDLLAALGHDSQTYVAARLRDFVLRRAEGHGLYRAKSIATAVRALVRFLSATGRCPAGLEHAIPASASWQLSATPRYLEPGDVERVLAACVSDDEQGLRDRAVMLLLARLGLRASDVAALSLRDIDWANGRLAVCGKGRRQEWLPLPQAVGDALLRYLREGRPPVATERVFLRVWAPLGPLTRAAVTAVARSALLRANIKAPINGAHVFRHSAATAMLRQGVSLAGVGAVLRHRSPSTTAHYAKVDFGLLGEVAQPWPEASRC